MFSQSRNWQSPALRTWPWKPLFIHWAETLPPFPTLGLFFHPFNSGPDHVWPYHPLCCFCLKIPSCHPKIGKAGCREPDHGRGSGELLDASMQAKSSGHYTWARPGEELRKCFQNGWMDEQRNEGLQPLSFFLSPVGPGTAVLRVKVGLPYQLSTWNWLRVNPDPLSKEASGLIPAQGSPWHKTTGPTQVLSSVAGYQNSAGYLLLLPLTRTTFL